MSECVVAESEARADMLQQWARYTDASVEACIKKTAKVKRQPYVALSNCLSSELAANPAAPATATTQVKVGDTGKEPETGTRMLKGLKSLFSSN